MKLLFNIASILILLYFDFGQCQVSERNIFLTTPFPFQNQKIAISGEHEVFGHWDTQKVTIMNRTEDPLVWSYTGMFDNDFYYYCVLTYNPDNESEQIITKMEASIYPRFLTRTTIENKFGEIFFGESVKETAFMTTTEENIIQFQLYNNPIITHKEHHFWEDISKTKRCKKHKSHLYDEIDLPEFICSFNLDYSPASYITINNDFIDSDDSNNINNCPILNISSITITPIMNGEPITNKYDAQVTMANLTNFEEFEAGNVIENLNPDDVIIMQIRIPKHFEIINYEIKIKFENGDESIKIITRAELTQSDGVILVKYEKIYIKLHYLIINPLRIAEKLTFKNTLENNWFTTNANIGKRGVGQTAGVDPDSPNYPSEHENTVASIKKAARLNPDMVQIGITVTKDLKIIASSNTSVFVSNTWIFEPQGPDDLLQIEIGSLTFDEIQSMETYTIVNDKIYKNAAPNDETDEDRKLFQDIDILLENVPSTMAVMIIISSPLHFKNGAFSAHVPIDINVYLDAILEKLILTKNCGHYLILASYSPNLCSMLKLKQNVFPVLIMIANRIDDRDFNDPRISHVDSAVAAAKAWYFMGIIASNVYVKANLEEFAIVSKYSQQLYVWYHEGIATTEEIDDLNNEIKVAGSLYSLEGVIKSNAQSKYKSSFSIEAFVDATCFNDTSL